MDLMNKEYALNDVTVTFLIIDCNIFSLVNFFITRLITDIQVIKPSEIF